MKLFEAMLILFIGLKLTGYIDWSWWLVLMPLWLPMCAAMSVLAYIFVESYFKVINR